MNATAKLTVIVRTDLRPGQQACQAMHAQRQFQHVHPETEAQWFAVSNTLALLAVPDEIALRQILGAANDLGIRTAHFCEPDLKNSLTAICFEPSESTKKLTKELPKALEGR